eukprot:5767887-Prymnesium_polylepis.1
MGLEQRRLKPQQRTKEEATAQLHLLHRQRLLQRRRELAAATTTAAAAAATATAATATATASAAAAAAVAGCTEGGGQWRRRAELGREGRGGLGREAE